MTEDQTPSPLRDDTDIILPAVAYLRYESRADGWSAGRQAACLAHLADNGMAGDAVRSVGMSPAGSYALRRTARGYAFNLGWEVALIIARRIVTDHLMTAAIRGEQSVWLREDGKTTFTRQNTKLSLTLLDRVNPATALPEVMAVAARFDWFLQLIDEGASGEVLWKYFFDDALPHSEHQARARVRASLLLSEESAGFDEDDGRSDDDIEYKSMEGVPCGNEQATTVATNQFRRPARDAGLGYLAQPLEKGLTPHQVRGDEVGNESEFRSNLSGFARPKIPKVDAAHQAAYLRTQARPGHEAHSTKYAPPKLITDRPVAFDAGNPFIPSGIYLCI